MSLSPSDRVRVPSHVMARVVGEEVVILDLVSGTYFGLDAIGARAWQLWNEDQSIEEACDRMAQEYDVARASLEADLLDLAAKLQAEGLVLPQPPLKEA